MSTEQPVIFKPHHGLCKCVMCGARGKDIMTSEAIMSNIMGFCAECLREHGVAVLVTEANRQLAAKQNPLSREIDPAALARIRGKCLHCGNRVIQNINGSWPLWCEACNRERPNIHAA